MPPAILQRTGNAINIGRYLYFFFLIKIIAQIINAGESSSLAKGRRVPSIANQNILSDT